MGKQYKTKMSDGKSGKKGSRSKALLSIFLGLIMVSSVIGFMYGGFLNESSVKYGKYKFSRQDAYWSTTVNGKTIYFYFIPQQLSDVKVSGNPFASVKQSRMIYLSYVPNQTTSKTVDLIRYLISQDLQIHKNIYVAQGAAFNFENLPQVTCLNSTVFVPVLMISNTSDESKGNENSASNSAAFISQHGNCILISADTDEGLLKARDRLMYGVLEVMQNEK